MSSLKLEVGEAARVFRALGEPIRLRLVALLAHGELCVCHLTAALELPQSTISRHLGLLRAAGIVDARRQGSWIHYRLARPDDGVARAVLRALARQLVERHALKRDLERLVASRGPKSCK